MDTMPYYFGIDDYIYYNNSVSRKSDKGKEIAKTEINKSKLYLEGEKNR